jgi:hypothetical protein
LLGFVPHIGGGAEEPEGAVIATQAGEEHDRCAALDVVDVSRAGVVVCTGA